MIARVEVGGGSDVLPLKIIPLGHGVRRIAELDFLLAVPNDFSC